MELLKSDIFFFVTTIAVIVIGVLLLIALIYTIKILRDIKHVSRAVKEESDKIIEEVENVRTGFLSKIVAFFNPIKKTKRKKS